MQRPPTNPRWIALGLLAVLGAACSSTRPDPLDDPMPRDGEEALDWLLAGNERFVADRLAHDRESVARRMKLESGQQPFAVILGCADSRVVPELIFDQGLGDIFVIRVAGNVVADDEAGSIEYAVEHLEVPLVLVLGHEGCGAVTAGFMALDGEVPELATLLSRLKPALAGIDPDLPLEQRVAQGVEANVRKSLEDLLAIIRREGGPIRPGQRIYGGVYELGTGRVRILDRDVER